MIPMSTLREAAAAYKDFAVLLAYPTERTVAVLRARLGVDADLDRLKQEYQATFGGPLPGSLPPLEAEYDQAHVFAKSHTLADLAGLYRAFGLQVSEGLHRVDHIAVELEFAHVLAVKEARAAERGESERAATCREARRILLAEHLGAWGIPYLARVHREVPGAYGEVAEKARDLLLEACREAGVALLEQRAAKDDAPRPTGEDACPVVREAVP